MNHTHPPATLPVNPESQPALTRAQQLSELWGELVHLPLNTPSGRALRLLARLAEQDGQDDHEPEESCTCRPTVGRIEVYAAPFKEGERPAISLDLTDNGYFVGWSALCLPDPASGSLGQLGPMIVEALAQRARRDVPAQGATPPEPAAEEKADETPAPTEVMPPPNSVAGAVSIVERLNHTRPEYTVPAVAFSRPAMPGPKSEPEPVAETPEAKAKTEPEPETKEEPETSRPDSGRDQAEYYATTVSALRQLSELGRKEVDDLLQDIMPVTKGIHPLRDALLLVNPFFPRREFWQPDDDGIMAYQPLEPSEVADTLANNTSEPRWKAAADAAIAWASSRERSEPLATIYRPIAPAGGPAVPPSGTWMRLNIPFHAENVTLPENTLFSIHYPSDRDGEVPTSEGGRFRIICPQDQGDRSHYTLSRGAAHALVRVSQAVSAPPSSPDVFRALEALSQLEGDSLVTVGMEALEMPPAEGNALLDAIALVRKPASNFSMTTKRLTRLLGRSTCPPQALSPLEILTEVNATPDVQAALRAAVAWHRR